MADLAWQVEELELECEALAAENEELKALLDNRLDLDALVYNMKLYGVWTQQIDDFINFCKETGKLCQN